MPEAIESDITFYFDESGHSGDMVNCSQLEEQPFFVLAALGLTDTTEFESRVADLRSQHGIPAGELKSKSLTKKPRFSADLIKDLIVSRVPIFVEVVDKRFFICANVASFHILPPSLGDRESLELSFVRNGVAEFLYRESSGEFLDSYVEACVDPCKEKVMQSFRSLESVAQKALNVAKEKEVAVCLLQMIEDAKAELHKRLRTDVDAHLHFLPPPDQNQNKKNVWMLPNLTSFTNIYARLNQFYNGKLSSLRLVHDQQLEVEDILRLGKSTAETLEVGQIPRGIGANFSFDETATLDFADSNDKFGVQLADVVAGAVMRCFRDKRHSMVDSELECAIGNLIVKSNEESGYGINQVVPSHKTKVATFNFE